MKYLEKVKNWPVEKKRIFSISVSIFLTILVIILNYGVGLVWQKPVPVNTFADKENPINKLAESLKKNLDIVQPALDKAFADMSTGSTSEQIDKLAEEINSLSSSSSTTTDVVQ